MKEERFVMSLRLPPALAEEVKKIAERERRNINTTIQIALEEYVEREREKSPPAAPPLDKI